MKKAPATKHRGRNAYENYYAKSLIQVPLHETKPPGPAAFHKDITRCVVAFYQPELRTRPDRAISRKQKKLRFAFYDRLNKVHGMATVIGNGHLVKAALCDGARFDDGLRGCRAGGGQEQSKEEKNGFHINTFSG